MEYSAVIKKEMSTQVLVIGGGIAGFGAALSAARNGAETLLIEKTSVLGGMATAGLVGPFMTCFNNNDDGKGEDRQLIRGVFEELLQRTEAKGGAIHPSKVEGSTSYCSFLWHSHRHVTPFQSEILALVMDEMLEEAGVKVLFGVNLCDCIVADNKVNTVIVSMKEGLGAIHTDVVIDCTGDADAAYFAGVPTIMGDGNGTMQPTTLFFEVNNIDRDAFVGALQKQVTKNYIPGAHCFHELIHEKRESGEWTIDRDELGNYEQNIQGRWKINTTRMAHVDSTNTEQCSDALREGRKQVQQVLGFMHKYLPGCENAQIVQVASALGVRESRHIVGLYTQNADDIMGPTHFEDAVVTFGYALDLHNSKGGGVTFTTVNDHYTIPYRCLVPQKCDNMLVAGRCISGTSEAAASYRVMPSCCALGQAAGTAAALCVKDQVKPADVDIGKLKSVLKEQDAVIDD